MFHPSELDQHFEPAFADASDLCVRRKQLARRILTSIDRGILSRPGDLALHVRKIKLCTALEKPPLLFAGLLDLFVVLGDKGTSLKLRMLRYGAKLLSENQYVVLQTHLGGVSESHVWGYSPYTLLCRQMPGISDFVRPYPQGGRYEVVSTKFRPAQSTRGSA